MQDQVIGFGDVREAAQHAPEQGGQLPPARTGLRLLEDVAVAARHQPHLKGHARGVRTKSDVVALRVHDAPALLLFLAENVAKDAAFLSSYQARAERQLVEKAPRDKHRGRNLRVRMRPLLARQRAAILEDGDVLEARISLQIQDALGIGFEDALDLLVLHAAEPSVVVGRFDDDLVSAHGAHAVVNAFRSARSFALDAIQGIEMRDRRAPGEFRRTAAPAAQDRRLTAPGRAGKPRRARELPPERPRRPNYW